MNTYQQVGQSLLDKYSITLCPRSVCTCWGRPHAHPESRKICKMDLPKGRSSLFEFLHEVGHIVHPQGGYKGDRNPAKTRALAEYNATQWAITEMRALGYPVPLRQIKAYNRYVSNKIARGLRRGLKRVPRELQHLKPKYW